MIAVVVYFTKPWRGNFGPTVSRRVTRSGGRGLGDVETLRIVVYNAGTVNSYDLQGPRITVGRTRDCDIVLRRGSVSKLHCYLLSHERVCMMVDANSTCGTWVDDIKRSWALLNPRSVVGLPDSHLLVANCRESSLQEIVELVRSEALPEEMQGHLAGLDPQELQRDNRRFAFWADAFDRDPAFWELGASSDVAKIRRIVAMRCTLGAVVRGLRDDHDHDVRRIAASASVWTEDELAAMAKSSDVATRRGVAENAESPPAVLCRLARDSRTSVRFGVAGNPATPPDVLEALIADDSLDVKMSARRTALANRSGSSTPSRFAEFRRRSSSLQHADPFPAGPPAPPFAPSEGPESD